MGASRSTRREMFSHERLFQGGSGGDFNLTARDVTVATMGAAAYGVFGRPESRCAGASLDTAGEFSHAVYGFRRNLTARRHRHHDGGGCLVRQGTGDASLDVVAPRVRHGGRAFPRVSGFQGGGGGDFNLARDVTVATMGAAAYGVFRVRARAT